MNEKIEFFLDLFTKFKKYIEIYFFNIEAKILSYLSRSTFFENTTISSLGILNKLSTFMLNLFFSTKVFRIKNKLKSKWFHLVIKVIEKKLKLFHSYLSYRTTHRDPNKFVYGKKDLTIYIKQYWESKNFLTFNQNCTYFYWKLFKIIFFCSICRKTISCMKYREHFVSIVYTTGISPFSNSKLLTSTSNCLVCNICGNITKVIKKVSLIHHNFFIFDFLLLLNEKYQKKFNQNIINYSKNFKFISFSEKNFFFDGIYVKDTYIEKRLCFFKNVLIYFKKNFMKNFQKFQTIKINSKDFKMINSSNRNKFKKFLPDNPVLLKLQKYKVIEHFFLKFIFEKMINEVIF
jgi:hypothetical protein